MNVHIYVLTFVWIIYLAGHSLFAGNRVKTFASGIMGRYFSWYRIIYVVCSTLLLAMIGIYVFWIPSTWIFHPFEISGLAGIVSGISGIIIIQRAFKEYDIREFLGTLFLRGNEDFKDKLKTSGILSYVRHPLYSATILIAVGFFLLIPTTASLLSVTCITIYLFIGIKIEEAKLEAEFGSHYREYKKDVPMIVPRISRLIKKDNTG